MERSREKHRTCTKVPQEGWAAGLTVVIKAEVPRDRENGHCLAQCKLNQQQKPLLARESLSISRYVTVCFPFFWWNPRPPFSLRPEKGASEAHLDLLQGSSEAYNRTQRGLATQSCEAQNAYQKGRERLPSKAVSRCRTFHKIKNNHVLAQRTPDWWQCKCRITIE